MAGVVLVVVGVAVYSVVKLINPRVGWSLRRWQYRNPDRVEPSTRWLVSRRIGAGFGAVMCMVVLWFLVREIVEASRLPADTALADERFDRAEGGERVLWLGQARGDDYGILGYEDAGDHIRLTVAVPPCYGDPVVHTEEFTATEHGPVNKVYVGVQFLERGEDCDVGDEVITHRVEDVGRSFLLWDPDGESISSLDDRS
jgi:hypothetical protein